MYQAQMSKQMFIISPVKCNNLVELLTRLPWTNNIILKMLLAVKATLKCLSKSAFI